MRGTQFTETELTVGVAVPEDRTPQKPKLAFAPAARLPL